MLMTFCVTFITRAHTEIHTHTHTHRTGQHRIVAFSVFDRQFVALKQATTAVSIRMDFCRMLVHQRSVINWTFENEKSLGEPRRENAAIFRHTGLYSIERAHVLDVPNCQ